MKRLPETGPAAVVPAPTRLQRIALQQDGDLETWLDETAARGDAAVSRLAEDFDHWAEEEVRRLVVLHDAYRSKPDARAGEALVRAGRDLGSSAGTLGYPLLGRICASLLRLMKEAAPPADLVARHVEAVQALMRERVRGDDHPVAAALTAELERLTAAGPFRR